MLELNKIYNEDCLEGMKKIPDRSIDLIVIDPPYNIGKDSKWDKWNSVEEYVFFMTKVFKECERVLKCSGSFYFFHNDFLQIVELQNSINKNTSFLYKQLIVWNKRFEGAKNKGFLDGFIEVGGLRNFQQMSEYCLYYTLQDESSNSKELPLALKPIREYMNKFREKKGLNFNQIDLLCGWVRKKNNKQGTGLARHFFQGQGSYIFPTREVYDKLNKVLEFDKSYDDLREIYESLRYTFNNQKTHHSVWNYEIAPKNGHITPKPVPFIENIILHSSNEGDIVLDCFMGSGTTAIACINTNRNYIGFELDNTYYSKSLERIMMHSD